MESPIEHREVRILGDSIEKRRLVWIRQAEDESARGDYRDAEGGERRETANEPAKHGRQMLDRVHPIPPNGDF